VELLVDPPKPAIEFLPEWYTKAKTGRENPKFTVNGSMSSITFKACMPFYDAMRSGYIQSAWVDIRFETNEQGDDCFYYRSGPQIVQAREKINKDSVSANSEIYSATDFVWCMPWIPKTPKGWSVLVTSPLNRFDLPFTVTSGIIDSDKFHHCGMGLVPFYLHKNFSGTIKAGTPIFQIIPFKREPKWKSFIEEFNADERTKNEFSVLRKFTGAYRDNFWVNKQYE
jgi:hypothetical protein